MKNGFGGKQLILAPMAGITDLPFRLVCKEHGADIVYSEMVSATGLALNKANILNYVNSCQQDMPLFLQLFGSNYQHFIKALKIIDKLPPCDQLGENEYAPRKPEGIDINFGCPVKKVLKQNAGCVLMDDLVRSRQIVKAVVENTDLDVSIKIRTGYKKVKALEFLDNIVDLDWKTVIIHGRTFAEGFSGSIDQQIIKKVKEVFPNKKVIANGGIFSPEIAIDVLNQTSADGIAIARGALGYPWIFEQTKKLMVGKKNQKPSVIQISSVARNHLELFTKIKGADMIKEMRKHLGWYVQGLPDAKKLRREIFSINSSAEALAALDKITTSK